MNLLKLVKKGGLRGLATATPATPATDQAIEAGTIATVATVAVAKAAVGLGSEATDPALDRDRWCWPNSTAMNTAEIDTFTARLDDFTRRGLAFDDAEKLADKLVLRDRDLDDRRLCPECQHLHGNRPSAWRCGNWKQAGIAVRASDAQLSAALVHQLQRCDGFTAQHTEAQHDEQ